MIFACSTLTAVALNTGYYAYALILYGYLVSTASSLASFVSDKECQTADP